MSSFERIHWFYKHLKQKNFPTRLGYMETFEVSESTFKRDLAFMRDRLGAPIEYDPAKNGYALTNHAFEIPSFWFNRMQLIMMIGILKQLQKMEGLAATEALGTFRDRLQKLLILGDGSDITDCFSFENVGWALCDGQHVDMLIEAILQKRLVRFTYHAAGSNTITRRTVEPYRLHNYMGTWYLIGFCHNKKEARVFQIARLVDLEISTEFFGTRQFDVATFIDNAFGIFKGTTAFEVVLRFDPFIAGFVRNEIWHERQQITVNEDGRLIMTLPVADLTEIRMKVLKYGHHVEVVRPEELRRQVAEEAKKMVEIYET